jgi:hypothetical protein
MLIPTRYEYKEADMDSNIWWKKNELNSFKCSAEEEIRAVMAGLRTDLMHARTMLYQPLSSIVSEWNKS